MAEVPIKMIMQEKSAYIFPTIYWVNEPCHSKKKNHTKSDTSSINGAQKSKTTARGRGVPSLSIKAAHIVKTKNSPKKTQTQRQWVGMASHERESLNSVKPKNK